MQMAWRLEESPRLRVVTVRSSAVHAVAGGHYYVTLMVYMI